MFTANGLKRGDCDAKEAHADREVLEVQDLLTKQTLNLCPKCFLEQLRLRSKGKKVEPAPHENGRPDATPASS